MSVDMSKIPPNLNTFDKLWIEYNNLYKEWKNLTNKYEKLSEQFEFVNSKNSEGKRQYRNQHLNAKRLNPNKETKTIGYATVGYNAELKPWLENRSKKQLSELYQSLALPEKSKMTKKEYCEAIESVYPNLSSKQKFLFNSLCHSIDQTKGKPTKVDFTIFKKEDLQSILSKYKVEYKEKETKVQLCHKLEGLMDTVSDRDRKKIDQICSRILREKDSEQKNKKRKAEDVMKPSKSILKKSKQ